MQVKKHILIIEDEQDIIKIAAFRFRQAGYEVSTASDGETALELAGSKNPDLIILHLNIPKITGKNVCLRLKKDKRFENIPIIIMTASHNAEVMYRETGADDYIQKPYEIQELLAKVQRLLQKIK